MRLASSGSLYSNVNLYVFHSALKSYIESKNPGYHLVLFRQLLQSQVKPNDLTFSLLIKACVTSSSSSSSSLNSCNAILEANQLHGHMIKLGTDRFMYLSTALLDLYMKLGCVKIARNLFDDLSDRDVVSWNALICGYSRNGYDFDALTLFNQMRREAFSPRQATLISLVPSCGRVKLLVQGKSVHGFGIKGGLDLDCQVKNALTSMYAKCADLGAAEFLFGEIIEKNVVSWNTMIGAYGQNGFFDEALLVFKEMLYEKVEVNSVTLASVLSSNADPEVIHSYAMKTGTVKNDSVITSLVCTHAKYGNIGSAEMLYMSLSQKNLISLTAIISGHAEKGNMGLVLEWFSQMQKLHMKLDAVALVSILHGITSPAHFRIGLAFHGFGVKSGLSVDYLVANGLISMYSKFDEVETAFSLFCEMDENPLISWNSLISGCVQMGRSNDALELFVQMITLGHFPDSITLASLLSGCCQLGNLLFGQRLHSYIVRNNIEVEDFVGTALVDMYIKCGRIEQAEKVFKSIKKPCVATWNTMISGYSLFGFETRAITCYAEMIGKGLRPDKITFLGILAACTHGGLLSEGRRYFHIMKEEFGILPGLQHCACMVGLLGRAGLFEEAFMFIKDMEIEPDSAVWGALLSACCVHREVKLGECLAKKLLFLDYRNGGFFVLMSNLYAGSGRWDDVERVRKMMRDTGGDGCSGVSVIEAASSVDMNQELSLSMVNFNRYSWQAFDFNAES